MQLDALLTPKEDLTRRIRRLPVVAAHCCWFEWVLVTRTVQVFPCDAKWPKWENGRRRGGMGLLGYGPEGIDTGRLVHAVKPFQHSNRTSPKAVLV